MLGLLTVAASAGMEALKKVDWDTTLDVLDTVFSDDEDFLLDEDDDGDIDRADYALTYAKMMASIWGHIAQADGEIQEEEEEKIYELMDTIIFSGSDENEPLLSSEILSLSGKKKREVKKEILKLVKKPLALKKIATFVEATEMEENFYTQAVIIASAEGDIDEDEREFLEMLADKFELSKFEVKRIEKSIL